MKLKPWLELCPFCGSKAILNGSPPEFGPLWSVSCECGALFQNGFIEKSEAIARWNDRRAPQAPGAGWVRVEDGLPQPLPGGYSDHILIAIRAPEGHTYGQGETYTVTEDRLTPEGEWEDQESSRCRITHWANKPPPPDETG